VKHTELQIRFNSIDVEIPGESELPLEIADLVLAIGLAVALGGVLFDAAIDRQHPLLQRDLQTLRAHAGQIRNDDKAGFGLVDVNPWYEGRPLMGPLACLLLSGQLALQLRLASQRGLRLLLRAWFGLLATPPTRTT